MEGNLIQVNVPNTITIGLMVALGVMVTGAISYAVHSALGISNGN